MTIDQPPVRTRTAAASALRLVWDSGPLLASVNFSLNVIQGLLPAVSVWLTKELIDGIQDAQKGRMQILALAIAAAVAGLASVIMSMTLKYTDSRLQRSTGLIVQRRLYAATNQLDGLLHFENPRFLGKLSLAQQTSVAAPHQLNAAIFNGTQNTVSIVGFALVLGDISPLVLLLALVASTPALTIHLRLGREHADLAWTATPAVRRQMFYQMLLVDPSAVKEIRLFGLGDFFARRMHDETEKVRDRENALDRKELARRTPLALIGSIITGIGLVWLAWRALEGRSSLGDVAAFIASTAGLQAGLLSLSEGLGRAAESVALVRNYLEVLNTTSDLTSPATSSKRPQLERSIEFRDVWFRYGDGPWILRGLTFTIKAGETLAVVGLNGSGKSTVVKLLCRLYDPERGGIFWDGVDIRELNIPAFRERVTAVFQDYMAYSLTASENIGLGNLRRLGEIDRASEAAQRAGIDDVIERLPRGYETLLSRTYYQGEDESAQENGVLLSGGQWQRVALARLLMRKESDLVILDEPSSGLDAEAEQRIHEEVSTLRAASTCVLISHRLAAVRRADRIVVIADGRVIEQGDHPELMEAQGMYCDLFTRQADGYRHH